MISVEEQRPGGPIPVPHIPDDLTVPQFLLDAHHSYRSPRSFGVPWFVDDETGSFGLLSATSAAELGERGMVSSSLRAKDAKSVITAGESSFSTQY